jgi:hypothetical protein
MFKPLGGLKEGLITAIYNIYAFGIFSQWDNTLPNKGLITKY